MHANDGWVMSVKALESLPANEEGTEKLMR